MGCWNYNDLKEHIGHKIVCVCYGKQNVSIECEDCNEVILSYDKELKGE